VRGVQNAQMQGPVIAVPQVTDVRNTASWWFMCEGDAVQA